MMERFTQKTKDGYAIAPELQTQAIMRLGRWEDTVEQLEHEQAEIAAQMESLRAAGKENCAVSRIVCTQADGFYDAGYTAPQ